MTQVCPSPNPCPAHLDTLPSSAHLPHRAPAPVPSPCDQPWVLHPLLSPGMEERRRAVWAAATLLPSLGLSLPLLSPSLPPVSRSPSWKAIPWGPCWRDGVGAGEWRTPGCAPMGPQEGAGSGGQGPGTGVCTLPLNPRGPGRPRLSGTQLPHLRSGVRLKLCFGCPEGVARLL